MAFWDYVKENPWDLGKAVGDIWNYWTKPAGRSMEEQLRGTRTAELAMQQTGMFPWQMTDTQLSEYNTGLGRSALTDQEERDWWDEITTRNEDTQMGGSYFYDIPPQSQWPEGFTPAFDSSAGAYYWAYSGSRETGMTEYQREQLEAQEEQHAREMEMQRQQMQYQQEIAEAQLAWEQELYGMQAEQQQQNYLSNLRANPVSWLEYAAASGKEAAIQPWMIPLMQGQQGMQAGGAIPGFEGAEGMTEMPELLRPSAQYAARMGPTAQQQYYGYQQGQQGATPEETQWRMWSSAPPSGRFGGLSRRR